MLVSKKSTRLTIFGLSLFIGLVFVFGLNIIPTAAAPNLQMNYQGKLSDLDNDPVPDGLYQMEFSLCDALENGNCIWTESRTSTEYKVQIRNGLFSVMLGAVTPLTGVSFNQVLYLEVKVGTSSLETLAPRKIIGSVPSAFEAQRLSGLASSSFLRSDATNTVALFDAASSTNFFANVFNALTAVIDNLTAAVANLTSLVFGNATGTQMVVGDLQATSTATLASTTVTGQLTLGSLNGLLNATDGVVGTTSFSALGITSSQWITNGSDIYYDGGNVGIGTATPNNLLQVYDLINFNNTDHNTQIGYQAGKNLAAGADANTFLGYQAGLLNVSANSSVDWNTGVGYQTLYSNYTGQGNTALGYHALYANYTGHYNVAIGMDSLPANTGGDENIGLGHYALYTNTTGDNNTAIGYAALGFNATGSNNIAVGPWAGAYELGSNSFYLDNQDRGSSAGDKAGALLYGTFDATPANQTLTINASTTVSRQLNVASSSLGYWLGGQKFISIPNDYNLAIGHYSLAANTTGLANLGIGINTLAANQSGSDNLAFGVNALVSNVSGNHNIAVGVNALVSNVSGSWNIALGTDALASTTGSNNIAIGYQVLDINTTGIGNIGIGKYALTTNINGYSNLALGGSALSANISGVSNVALGQGVLQSSQGNYNAALGVGAGYSLVSGSNNVFLGSSAGYAISTGTGNIIIGYNADATSSISNNYLNIGNTIYGNLASDYVGIGIVSPSVSLEVAGTISSTDLQVNGNATITSWLAGTSDNYIFNDFYDIAGGGQFNLPRINFHNDNAMGADPRIGAVTAGLFLIDDVSGTPMVAFLGASISENYALLQYNTSTETLTLNPNASDGTEYLEFKAFDIDGTEYMTVKPSSDGGQALAVDGSLFLYSSTSDPAIYFYNDNTDTLAGLSVGANGMTVAGSIVALQGATNTTTGLKEAFVANGDLFGGGEQGEKIAIVFKGGADLGLQGNKKLGAVSGVIDVQGDYWKGGLSFDYWNYLNTTTPLTAMYINGDGNVGVGLTSPSVKLEVAGTISSSQYNLSGTTGLEFQAATSVWAFKYKDGVIPTAPTNTGLLFNLDAAAYQFKVNDLNLFTVSGADGSIMAYGNQLTLDTADGGSANIGINADDDLLALNNGYLDVNGYLTVNNGGSYNATLGNDSSNYAGYFYSSAGPDAYLAFNFGGNNYALWANGDSYLNGNVTTTGDLSVEGNTVISGLLEVAGAISSTALQVNGNATVTGQIVAGMNSRFGDATRYWQVETLDLTVTPLGSLGYYPMLTPYSDGVFPRIGAIANELMIFDKASTSASDPQFTFLSLYGAGAIGHFTMDRSDNEFETDLALNVLGYLNSNANGDYSAQLGNDISLYGGSFNSPAASAYLAYNDGSSDYAIYANGDSYLNGNVGIGTSTPNNLLQVYDLIDFNNTDYNTKIGYQAGKNIVSGAGLNTFVGYEAGKAAAAGGNDGADVNTAIGARSLFSNTTGIGNTAIGAYALYTNAGGQYNTANGHNALQFNTEGDENVAMGYLAINANDTGNKNVSIGVSSLLNNTSGSNNIALGYDAGRFQADGATSLTDPENSIYLGYGSRGKDNDDSNSIVIGYNAVGLGANSVVLGSDSIATTALKGSVGIGTTTPDANLHVYQSTNARVSMGVSNVNAGASAYAALSLRNGATLNDAALLRVMGTGYSTPVGAEAFMTDAAVLETGANLSNGLSVVTTNADADIRFYTGGTADANQRLIITDSGNIGIGTSTPQYRMEMISYDGFKDSTFVIANFSTDTATSSAAANIGVSNGTSFFDALTISVFGSNFNTNTPAFYQADYGVLSARPNLAGLNIGSMADTGTIKFYTAGQDESNVRMVVSSAGYIGIGTTTPTANLHIYKAGAAAADVLLGISTSTSGGGQYIFKVLGSGQVMADNGTLGSPADYAEYYYSRDADLSSGEAVCVDVTRNNAVVRCTRAGDDNIMGIISTKPLILGNAKEQYQNNPNYKMVAMLGQIPAKASNENGEIRPGDYLTAASIPGYVMKAGTGDSTVGVALESLDSNTGTINVMISRRNKSLTVEQVEEAVTQRIADMELEDEVNIMLADTIQNYDFTDDIASYLNPFMSTVDAKLALLSDSLNLKVSELTSTTLGATNNLTNQISASNNLISLLNEQVSTTISNLSVTNERLDGLDALILNNTDRLTTLELFTSSSIADLQAAIMNLRVQPATSTISYAENFDSLSVSGDSQFNGTIRVVGDAEFMAKIIVRGQVAFGGDSVGQVKIVGQDNPLATTTVHVAFEEIYANLPIITVTPIDYDGKWKLSYVATTGFDIIIDPIPEQDVVFNWHAFSSLPETKLIVSDGTVGLINDPEADKLVEEALPEELPEIIPEESPIIEEAQTEEVLVEEPVIEEIPAVETAPESEIVSESEETPVLETLLPAESESTADPEPAAAEISDPTPADSVSVAE